MKLKIPSKHFVLLIIVFFVWEGLSAQTTNKIPDDFCISADDNKLLESINQFLVENGKKDLDYSISLSYVAKLHVNDLLQNHPDTSVCNLSSWSNKGEWTDCCYQKYVPNQDCMWEKPKELTSFKYRGYEMAFYFEEDFNSDTVMQLLLSSNAAIDMLLTKGDYSKKNWVCMGVALNNKYASIWFAQRADNAGKPKLCDNSKVNKKENAADSNTIYYIVVSSFTEMKDAKEALKRLTQNGFDKAGILKMGVNYRVYLNKLEQLKEAMYFKQKLPYTYNDAWILKE